MNYKNVKIDKTAKIAKQSVIIGDVTIGRDSCVLYYSVIRGDDAPIVIGEETNIQENCTVHVSRGLPVYIWNNVTIGHNAVIHSCTLTEPKSAATASSAPEALSPKTPSSQTAPW